MTRTIASMEPMLPPSDEDDLVNLAMDLTAKANRLGGLLSPVVASSVGDLVRSMNCYYSNLIEGHSTTPRDINSALKKDYSSEPKKRNLQLEAVAHIEVQGMIDTGTAPDIPALSAEFGRWIHLEFCKRLPPDLLTLENPDTGEIIQLVPGEYRQGEVIVGVHEPIEFNQVETFLSRFDEVYSNPSLSKLVKILAIPAAHHRYAWIHPFYDGNGRVIRLMSYAAMKEIGLGSELWSIARGLARRKEDYIGKMAAADNRRRNDFDGRGTLSQAALIEFCRFFLEVCIDQVEYMERILDFDELSSRIRIYVDEEIARKRLPKGSFSLLREALVSGEVERGRVPEITGYKDRAARDVMKALLDKELLVSDTPRGNLRLGFPIDVVERWFPLLYASTG